MESPSPPRTDQQQKLENLLHHVVLPRVLPQNYPKDYEDQELNLLSRLVRTVENSSQILPIETVELFQRLKRVHMKRTPENISNEINSLKPGDTFAMFIRRQNTAFLIQVPKEPADGIKNVTIATFPGNLHPAKMHESFHDLQVIVQ